MRSIRIAGAAGVVAMLFLSTFGAGSALAAPPSVVINSPGVDVAYEAYPTISGSITQDGNGGVVTRASVALSSNDGFSSENASKNYPPGGSGTGFEGGGANVTYSWKPTPRYNGKYTVTVSGTGRSNNAFGQPQAEQTNIVSRSFSIEIKPVKPTGVAAGMDDNSQVTVTWKANPEPDLIGYAVLRSYQNGSAGQVGSAVAPSSKPTFHDDLSGRPPGAYKYAVVAVRKARTCASSSTDDACTRPLEGPRSDFSAAVTVRGAGATTTTSTTTKKPSGGGSGGGSTGGGSTGGGSTGGGSTGGGTKPGSTGGGKAAPRNSGGFAPGGNVDLSQFGGLLGGNGRTSANGGQIDEGTYDPELRYDPSERPLESGGDDSLISIGGASVPAPNEDWVKFIGAGSFVTALLVHVLWFKQQVDALPLEAID